MAVALSMWSVVAAFLLFLFLWFNVPGALWSLYRKRKYVRRLPSWPTHWLWGHLHLIRRDEDTLLKWTAYIQKERHKVTQVWYGPFLAAVDIQHPEPVGKVLKEPKNRQLYRMLIPWLGEGLLIADGPKWYRNRRLLTPAFHFEILKPYVSVYNSCLSGLLEKWSVTAKRQEPVKLFDTISLLSLDIVLQCAFSYRSDCQNVSLKHPYIKAVYDLVDLCTKRFLNPLYHIDWIYALTTAGRKTRAACKLVHEHSERVIRERKKALGLDKKALKKDVVFERVAKQRKYLDFLDILLTTVDEDGNGLSDLEIRDEVDTFMFEGHDTTTSGISWTLYCLARYPEHQEKVREEVRNVLMGREWLDYDDLKELKYTQWVIKEAMRLYPPVFQVYRRTTEDIELNGYLIPKGVQIGIFIYTIHHNPDVWENPEEFDPLRFHPSNAEKRDPYAYMPFSAGPRNCIGQNFAMNEEKVVVGTIVDRFRLSLVEDHKVEMVPTVVLRTKNDIKLRLQPLYTC